MPNMGPFTQINCKFNMYFNMQLLAKLNMHLVFAVLKLRQLMKAAPSS